MLNLLLLFFLRRFSFSSGFESTYYRSSEVNCTITKFYKSSLLELKWIRIVDEVSEKSHAWTKGCKVVREDVAQIKTLLGHYEDWKNKSRIEDPLPGSWQQEGIMSYFEVNETCGGVARVMQVPIEPLIGFLRHPAVHCLNTKQSIVDKNYMFLSNREQIIPRLKTQGVVTRFYLFDLGASLYTSGLGGASQQWFVEVYRERGIEFDRILAWEASKHEPNAIFAEYTKDVAGKVSYFNVPAPMDVNDKMSPIRMIKTIVRPNDFLVLKIDIDNDPVEIAIIKSFIDDPSFTNLIDEFFFEHHVTNSPMEFLGWGLDPKVNNLTESYDLFVKLRNAGVRAHSWV